MPKLLRYDEHQKHVRCLSVGSLIESYILKMLKTFQQCLSLMSYDADFRRACEGGHVKAVGYPWTNAGDLSVEN